MYIFSFVIKIVVTVHFLFEHKPPIPEKKNTCYCDQS